MTKKRKNRVFSFLIIIFYCFFSLSYIRYCSLMDKHENKNKVFDVKIIRKRTNNFLITEYIDEDTEITKASFVNDNHAQYDDGAEEVTHQDTLYLPKEFFNKDFDKDKDWKICEYCNTEDYCRVDNKCFLKNFKNNY